MEGGGGEPGLGASRAVPAWTGAGLGRGHGLFRLQAEVVLQLLQPEQELLEGGPLVVVRMHADVCQLLQKKSTYQAFGYVLLQTIIKVSKLTQRLKTLKINIHKTLID